MPIGVFEAFRIYQSQGGFHAAIESLRISDLTPGDVVIRVRYSAINYKDALAGSGNAPILRKSPLNGGIDLAGTVLESDSHRYAPGDDVFVQGAGLSEIYDGGFSHYARLPAEILLPLLNTLSACDVMTIGTAGFTAALCIDRMRNNGQSPETGPVLVTGASGGVGSFAVCLLSQLGYECIAVSRKPSAKEYLVSLGASKVIAEVEETSAALTKQQWGGAIDTLGGNTLAAVIKGTRMHGNVVSVGLVQSAQLSVSVMPFIVRGVNLLGVTSANCPMQTRRYIWRLLTSEMKPERLDRIANEAVGLSNLPTQFRRLLAGEVCGRVLVDLSLV